MPLVISPITEDSQSLLNALPAVNTNLASLKGSRLDDALERAKQLLGSGDSGRSILLISDGDFEQDDLSQKVRELHRAGVTLHVLGIGTPGGGPIPAQAGQSDLLRDRSGRIIESKLNYQLLHRLAETGGGRYLQADFRDEDSETILELAAGDVAEPTPTQQKTRVWNEPFYWLLMPLMLLLLPRFRRRLRLESTP